jgi:hypothetical protein
VYTYIGREKGGKCYIKWKIKGKWKEKGKRFSKGEK